MLDDILSIDGVSVLNKKQQSKIKGGDDYYWSCTCSYSVGPINFEHEVQSNSIDWVETVCAFADSYICTGELTSP